MCLSAVGTHPHGCSASRRAFLLNTFVKSVKLVFRFSTLCQLALVLWTNHKNLQKERLKGKYRELATDATGLFAPIFINRGLGKRKKALPKSTVNICKDEVKNTNVALLFTKTLPNDGEHIM